MVKARRTKQTILPVGYIYKITSEDGTLIYYGATDNFDRRMRAHKSSNKRYLNSNGQYYTYCDILELPNYKTEIFQTHNNITWQDLLNIETDIIFNNPCVNKQSKKDSRSPEYIKNHNEKYNKENAAKLNEKFLCCECPGRYTHATKSKHFKTQIHIKALKLKLEAQENLLKEQAGQITEIKQEVKKIKLKMKNQPPQQITNNNININNAGDTPTTNINNN